MEEKRSTEKGDELGLKKRIGKLVKRKERVKWKEEMDKMKKFSKREWIEMD